MYYPKSKIITDLYTNGNEYVVKKTNEVYVGFYYKLYNGKAFSGKNPNDEYSQELTFINQNPNELSNKSPINQTQIPSGNFEQIRYVTLKQVSISNKLLPLFYYPQLTQKEYDLGEFQRFFVKKTNEIQFLEINKDDFTAIKDKDPKYAFESYIPFSFAWQIYGNRIDILKANKNTILLQEQRLKTRGLQEFLKIKYDKYYQYPVVNNLTTNGNELQRADQIEYIGPYHIEADRGFVVGSQPSNTEVQPTLFSINLEKEKILLDNALKLIGKFVYPTPIYDIIRKK